MDLELDHFFILVEPKAQVGDRLVELGMQESFSRHHNGQGTSNRRFEFSNSMLELLWVRDPDEANNGPGRNLRFPERAINSNASPFGIVLSKKNKSDTGMPFNGWQYQPDYFEPPMAFHIGDNASNILEPLCIYVPFLEPAEQEGVSDNIKSGKFKSISHVKIYSTEKNISKALAISNLAAGLTIDQAEQHLMEITFDDNRLGCTQDMRPNLPLIIHW